MAILIFFLWVLFFFASLLLIVVVLLQESKGGGLAEAFGGTGAETFGVKTGGINRFTFLVAAVFVVSAILIHSLRHAGTRPVAPTEQPPAIEVPGGGGK
jgi:protein translocase SecG subunit